MCDTSALQLRMNIHNYSPSDFTPRHCNNNCQAHLTMKLSLVALAAPHHTPTKLEERQLLQLCQLHPLPLLSLSGTATQQHQPLQPCQLAYIQ
jgi:hypothetical protein